MIQLSDGGPATAQGSRTRRRVVTGAAAVAAALGLQELTAGLTGWLPSLMAGSAAWVIDAAPVGLAEWAIHNLEYWTKRILIVGIALVLLSVGMLTSLRSRSVRWTAFGVGGVAGALATAHGEPGLFASLVSAAVAVGMGIGVDHWLRMPSKAPAGQKAPAIATGAQAPGAVPFAHSRRVFLTRAASVVALALAATAMGRVLLEGARRRLARRDDVVLPAAVEPVSPVTPAQQFAVEGLEPVVTPNDRFFVVDITALSPPEVDLEQWTLTVSGLVERELTLTYADLLDMEMVERYATIACVSNKVGGRLVGNAMWLGVPLSKILEMAGVDPRAEQVAATGADGFSTGFPLAAVFDRDSLLAIGMNGEPLPYKHGFPARLVVPGYYGFVSASKWVEQVRVTTWDDHDSYWVKMGWDKHAPVDTQSRIDAPRDRMSFSAGPRMIAGVAWAPYLGIARVEVQIDAGSWVDAELSEPIGPAAWVQWQLPWDAATGDHTIMVRATDGSGVTQTAETRAPVPSGATGHHTIKVRAQ